MAGIFSRYFTQPAPQKAAPQEANPPFPQMVQPIQNYYPTPVTPAQTPAPIILQGAAQVAQPVQQPVVQNGLGNWLLNQLNREQAEQAAPPPPPAMGPQPAPAQPADYTQQATAIAQWLSMGGQNPGLPVGTQPTAQLPIQVLDLPTVNNPMPGWSVPELQAQAAVNAPSGSIDNPAITQNPITAPGVVAGAEAGQNAVGAPGAVKGAEEGAKAGKDAQKNDTPVKPDERGAMFLMRPRGLSGPNAQREDAQELTNYEGLANNAQARRLTWDEYNKLSDDQRRVADLNKLLVRSREDDLDREGSMNEVQKARYYSNVASVFGPGGTQSETVAPRTVDLLASIDYNAVGKDLDDFLSLKEGISAKEQRKGDADMTAANAVRTRAETAFAEKPDQYWNLNSAVRDNTAENKGGRALPGFKGREPERDENNSVIWTKDFLYDRMYEGVRNNEPDWDEKNIEALLTKLEFDDADMRELGQALYLRAQNEKLYQPGESAVMSDDGKKKRRSPDEILKFLGMGG